MISNSDTHEMDFTTFNTEGLADVLKHLNDMDLYVHTIGECTSRTALDLAEQARKELGDAFRVKAS